MTALLNDFVIVASISSFMIIRLRMSLCHLYKLDLTYLLSVEFGMVYCGILAKNFASSFRIEIRISCGSPIGCWPAFVGANGLCSSVTCLVRIGGGLLTMCDNCVVVIIIGDCSVGAGGGALVRGGGSDNSSVFIGF